MSCHRQHGLETAAQAFMWKLCGQSVCLNEAAFSDFRKVKRRPCCILLTSVGLQAFPRGSVVKNPPAHVREVDSFLGSARSLEGGNGHPLQYSCLENPVDRAAWWDTVLGVAKSRTEHLHTQHTVGWIVASQGYHVLIHGTCKWYLVGEGIFVVVTEWRFWHGGWTWMSSWALNVKCVHIRRRHRLFWKILKRGWCDREGRTCRDAVTSQGMPAVTRSWKRQRIPLEPQEGVWPGWHLDIGSGKLILDSGVWNCERLHFYCFKLPSLW